jgi:hypothetical protein
MERLLKRDLRWWKNETPVTKRAPMQRYDGIIERTYVATHPEVIATTQMFQERFRKPRIFEKFEASAPISKRRAEVVGGAWHAFSEFVPWFLCHASAAVSTNRIRHYVIQTAFEELGMRDEREIHHEMFWKAAKVAELDEDVRERMERDKAVTGPLAFLRSKALAARSDAEVMGLLLGLEMPAVENISTVFQSLVHRPEIQAPLRQSTFFSFHMQIEIEHVRLTVSNFLRFCTTSEMKQEFLRGFDATIEFWSKFWGNLGALLKEEKVSRMS